MKQDNQPKLWFSSDLHQSHRQILKYCPNRKCQTVEEMEQKIIDNFNAVIKPEDHLIILGDVFLGNKTKAKEFLSKINGKKICIKGNHDVSCNQLMKIGFDWACYSMTVNIQGTPVLLSHYPYRYNFFKKWYTLIKSYLGGRRVDRRDFKQSPKDRGAILLHGHTHSTKKVNGRMINVGVDAWNLKPVSEDELASLINRIKNGESK
jgi:calcineurin-like phosphoesterase family protein